MPGLEKIENNDKLLAYIIRRNIQIEGTCHFSDESSAFQIAVHQRR